MIWKLLRIWLPPLVWAGVMVTFSTDTFSATNTYSVVERLAHWLYPVITHHQLDLIHFLIRKGAHWTEYFVFGLLICHGLSTWSGRRWQWSWGIGTLCFLLLFAFSDEVHQTFTHSRTGSIYDSFLDFFGGACAVCLVFLHAFLRKTKGAALTQ